MGLEKLVCQNCGSHDISYKDSFYVCGHCGAKHIMKDDPRNRKTDNSTNNSFEKIFVLPYDDSAFFNIKITYENNSDDKYGDEFATIMDTDKNKRVNKMEQEHYKQNGRYYNNDKSFINSLALALTVLFLFYSCAFDEDETAKQTGTSSLGGFTDSFSKAKVNDLDLLSGEAHPKLGAVKVDVEAYYDQYDDRVAVDDKYAEKPLMSIRTAGKSYNTYDKDKNMNEVEITLGNSKEKMVVGLDDAIKISESYIPWDMVEKYYKLDETVAYICNDSPDTSRVYSIRYGLKDIYSPRCKEQDHEMPWCYSTQIYLNKAGVVSNIHMREGSLYRFPSSEKQEWKPTNLHPLPKEPSTVLESWQLLRDIPKPRLLDDSTSMLAYGEKLGEERVFIAMRGSNHRIYGLSRDNQLVSAEFLDRKDGSKYIFSIDFDFTRFNKEKRVNLDEAVELVKGFLPYDIMAEFYHLRFARKTIPTAKNIDGVVSYKFVYDCIDSEALKAEIRKRELPRNISVDISEDYDKYVHKISVSCYTYMPDVISNRQIAYDEDGKEVDIRSCGRELGPYESNSSWYNNEPWSNPF